MSKHDIAFIHQVGSILAATDSAYEALQILKRTPELTATLSGNTLTVSRISYGLGRSVRIATITY